jgi:hypothetical protein
MRVVLSFVFAIFLASCSSKVDEVSLELVNNELTYNFNLDSLTYFAHESDQQRNQSTNVVKFRLTNSTKKKYLFLIRDKRLNEIAGIKINIYDGDTLLNANEPLITPATEESERERIYAYVDYEFYLQDREVQDREKLVGRRSNELPLKYMFQSVTVHPGETQTITTLLSLPFLKKNRLLNFIGPIYYSLKPDVKYTFSITYQIDAKTLKRELTTEQLKELEENEIEIFEGKLETEKIPIVNLFKSK